MTLVEVLVVLVIVGVSAGAVVLGLGAAGRGDDALTEANRLADRLRLAADTALIDGRPGVLKMDARGYGFDLASADDAFARHDLAGSVRMRADRGEVLIDPDGAEPPLEITVLDRERRLLVRFDGLNAAVINQSGGNAG